MKGMQEKDSISGVREDEKSAPRDHSLASLGKPRDVRQWPSGQIFLSAPHTHNRYLYYVTLCMCKIKQGWTAYTVKLRWLEAPCGPRKFVQDSSSSSLVILSTVKFLLSYNQEAQWR